MKTIKLTLAALAIAATAVTAYAISGGTEPAKKSENPPTIYYYGNTGDGVYIQIDEAQADPDENCGGLPDANYCIYQSLEDLPGGFTLGSPQQPEDITPKEGSNEALWEFIQPQR